MSEEQFALHPVIDVPQALLLEVAVGLDPLDEIAARHGYNPEQTEQLRKDPSFAIRVSQVAADLRKDGITFRMRAAHAAEDLIGHVWREARMSTTSLPAKLDALKTLAKLGDLEPKNKIEAPTGNGFSITINIPGQESVQVGRTIEHESITVAEPVAAKQPETFTAFRQINYELELPEDYETEPV